MLGGVIVEDDSKSVPLDVRGQSYHRPHLTQVLDFVGGLQTHLRSLLVLLQPQRSTARALFQHHPSPLPNLQEYVHPL